MRELNEQKTADKVKGLHTKKHERIALVEQNEEKIGEFFNDRLEAFESVLLLKKKNRYKGTSTAEHYTKRLNIHNQIVNKAQHDEMYLQKHKSNKLREYDNTFLEALLNE